MQRGNNLLRKEHFWEVFKRQILNAKHLSTFSQRDRKASDRGVSGSSMVGAQASPFEASHSILHPFPEAKGFRASGDAPQRHPRLNL